MLDWVPIRDPIARAKAQAAYCAKHPLPQPTIRRVVTGRRQGHYVSASGHIHHYGGAAGRRVAEMAARADCEPIPDVLVPFERDGQLVLIGQHGIYAIDMTPDSFKPSLERALQGERTADQPAAVIKQPESIEELQR